jgi:polyisoprenoid-binding protein YceI
VKRLGGSFSKATAALIVAAAATAAAHAQPVTYALDPERSFVIFEVVHFGTSTSRGRFGPLEGSVVLDRGAGRGEVSVRVDTTAVSTGIPVFDAVLRRPDLLSTTAFPEAYFVARSVRFDGDKVAEVRGEFTLRGIGQPLTLRALSFACRDQRCGGDFEGELLRSEFGITNSLPFVADRVRLRVVVEATPR